MPAGLPGGGEAANRIAQFTSKTRELHMTETTAAAEKKLDEITILAPNGAPKPYKYRPHDTVEKTLDKAVKEFAKEGMLDGSVAYSLVMGATALEPGSALEGAGVTAGATLKIRARQIPVDGDASRAL